MKTKIRRIVIAVLAACLIVAIYFSARSNRQIELDSGHRLVMGTFARIVVIAEDFNTAKKCIETALAEIHKVDDLMSDYKSDSEISLINKDAAKTAVHLSKATYEVLQRSIEFSKLTDGAFDVTVGPLVDLFHTAEKKQVAPTKEQISQAKSKVGFEKLKLDDKSKTVQFAIEGMRLDLGGIAKGYAIDKAVEALQTSGAIGGMVDLGGDIRCFGAPPKGRNHWLIGVQNPNLDEDIAERNLVLKLKLANGASATSGDYQQFVLIEGRRYSHIIDRKTGASAQGLSSVTIIADNATDADVLATAVSVMGAEKGLELIESTSDTEAILILAGKALKFITTANAYQFLSK